MIYNESPGYVYLAKKKRDLAQKLAFKKHITNQIDNIENQLQLIEEFLLEYSETPSSYAEFSAEDPKIQELIAPYFKTALDEYTRWYCTNYNKNPEHADQIVIPTKAGIKVRSKSEAIIAEGLFKGSLGYRYECALQLGNSIVYPDFTIIHPVTGKIYIWEHLGMMDNPGYLSKTMAKIAAYIQNKYLPTDNLILTWESAEVPLSPAYVEAVIDYYFLS